MYAAMGKSRRDGLAAVRLDPVSGDVIGAMSVDGVSGDELLDAFVQHWSSAAVVERVAGTIADRSVGPCGTEAGARPSRIAATTSSSTLTANKTPVRPST